MRLPQEVSDFSKIPEPGIGFVKDYFVVTMFVSAVFFDREDELTWKQINIFQKYNCSPTLSS